MATKQNQITAKDKFNALANATHIFAFKEEGTKFKIVDIVENGDSTKAVIQFESGELGGLFTDSASARDALKEVQAVFGDEQPFIVINMRETKKGASVYYVEVQ